MIRLTQCLCIMQVVDDVIDDVVGGIDLGDKMTMTTVEEPMVRRSIL